MNATFNETTTEIKRLENKLTDMSILIKNITVYKQTRPVFEKYMKAVFRDKFKKENESNLILYDAAKKELNKVLVDGKIPNLKMLKEEYQMLNSKKDELYVDYGNLKKQVKEYDIIKKNIDQYLSLSDEKSISDIVINSSKQTRN